MLNWHCLFFSVALVQACTRTNLGAFELNCSLVRDDTRGYTALRERACTCDATPAYNCSILAVELAADWGDAYAAVLKTQSVCGDEPTTEEVSDEMKGLEFSLSDRMAECYKATPDRSSCLDTVKTFYHAFANKTDGQDSTADRTRVLALIDQGARRKLHSMMENCTRSGSSMDACFQPATAELRSRLGRDVQAWESWRFLEASIEIRMQDFLSNCTEGASVCKQKATNIVSTLLGKAPNPPIEQWLYNAAAREADSKMEACMATRSNTTFCDPVVRAAVVKITRASVTDEEVIRLVQDGMRKRLSDDLRTCYEVSTMDSKSAEYTDQCVLHDKRKLQYYLGSAPDTVNVRRLARQAAVEEVRSVLKACRRTVTSAIEEADTTRCEGLAIQAARKVLGLLSVDAVEAKDMLEEARKLEVADRLRSCTAESLTKDQCRQQVCQAVADARMQDVSACRPEEEREYIDDAVGRTVRDELESCSMRAVKGDQVSEVRCQARIATAIAQVEGRPVSFQEVRRAQENAIDEFVADFMVTCAEREKLAYGVCLTRLREQLWRIRSKGTTDELKEANILRRATLFRLRKRQRACKEAGLTPLQCKARVASQIQFFKSAPATGEEMEWLKRVALEHDVAARVRSCVEIQQRDNGSLELCKSKVVDAFLEQRNEVATQEHIMETVHDAAKREVLERLRECAALVKESANATQIDLCKAGARNHARRVLLVIQNEVRESEVLELRRDAAREFVAEQVQLCRTIPSLDGTCTSSSRIRAALEEARADATATFTDEDMLREEEDYATRNMVRRRMVACDAAAGLDVLQKQACLNTLKDVVDSQLERTTTVTEVARMVRLASNDEMRDRLSSCIAANNTRLDCYAKAKAVKAQVTAKNFTEISAREIRADLMEAFSHRILDILEDCVEANENCSPAISGVLSSVSDNSSDVKTQQQFRRRAVVHRIAEKIHRCTELGFSRAVCSERARTVVKKAFARVDPSPAEVTAWVFRAARKRATTAVKDCVEATGSDYRQCVKSEAVPQVRKTMMDSTVPVRDVERFFDRQALGDFASCRSESTQKSECDELVSARLNEADLPRAILAAARSEVEEIMLDCKELGLDRTSVGCQYLLRKRFEKVVGRPATQDELDRCFLSGIREQIQEFLPVCVRRELNRTACLAQAKDVYNTYQVNLRFKEEVNLAAREFFATEYEVCQRHNDDKILCYTRAQEAMRELDGDTVRERAGEAREALADRLAEERLSCDTCNVTVVRNRFDPTTANQPSTERLMQTGCRRAAKETFRTCMYLRNHLPTICRGRALATYRKCIGSVLPNEAEELARACSEYVVDRRVADVEEGRVNELYEADFVACIGQNQDVPFTLSRGAAMDHAARLEAELLDRKQLDETTAREKARIYFSQTLRRDEPFDETYADASKAVRRIVTRLQPQKRVVVRLRGNTTTDKAPMVKAVLETAFEVEAAKCEVRADGDPMFCDMVFARFDRTREVVQCLRQKNCEKQGEYESQLSNILNNNGRRLLAVDDAAEQGMVEVDSNAAELTDAPTTSGSSPTTSGSSPTTGGSSPTTDDVSGAPHGTVLSLVALFSSVGMVI